MKKVFVMMLAAGAFSFAMMSCGGEKKETKTEDTAEGVETELAEPDKASTDDLIKQGQALVEGSDCKTCHGLNNKIVGPAHADVAKKYEFTQANVTMLAGKIINGGSGNWGEIAMTAHPDLSQADAEKMAMYVLSLDGEKLN